MEIMLRDQCKIILAIIACTKEFCLSLKSNGMKAFSVFNSSPAVNCQVKEANTCRNYVNSKFDLRVSEINWNYSTRTFFSFIETRCPAFKFSFIYISLDMNVDPIV